MSVFLPSVQKEFRAGDPLARFTTSNGEENPYRVAGPFLPRLRFQHSRGDSTASGNRSLRADEIAGAGALPDFRRAIPDQRPHPALPVLCRTTTTASSTDRQSLRPHLCRRRPRRALRSRSRLGQVAVALRGLLHERRPAAGPGANRQGPTPTRLGAAAAPRRLLPHAPFATTSTGMRCAHRLDQICFIRCRPLRSGPAYNRWHRVVRSSAGRRSPRRPAAENDRDERLPRSRYRDRL